LEHYFEPIGTSVQKPVSNRETDLAALGGDLVFLLHQAEFITNQLMRSFLLEKLNQLLQCFTSGGT